MLLAACAGRGRTSNPAAGPTQAPPDFLLGDFDDDYGGHPRISATRWIQGEGTEYVLVSWHPDAQYVIARNADTNRTAPGAWTRIDWMRLDNMPPYVWAYCLSAFDAPTRDSAERTRVADRATPRTGCNGFPFSRLKLQTSPPL